MIQELKEKIFSEKSITFEEALKLVNLHSEDFLSLVNIANSIKEKFCGKKVELCSILNAKSGWCPEDCSFCAQSIYYNTDCPNYPLMSKERILQYAHQVEKFGTKRFCVVTSGPSLNEDEFQQVLEIFALIKERTSLICNCSLGFLDENKAQALKEIGVDEYNHNLETSDDFYSNICTTHNFEDRLNTVKIIKEVGLKACCGGIIGMGESWEQRLKLAFAARELNVDCFTLNVLNPRIGTPLEKTLPLPPLEIIKTIAIFRMILPNSTIKIAGGRETNLRDLQSLSLLSGANGLIIGGYLTTKGRAPENDLQMIKDLGLIYY